MYMYGGVTSKDPRIHDLLFFLPSFRTPYTTTVGRQAKQSLTSVEARNHPSGISPQVFFKKGKEKEKEKERKGTTTTNKKEAEADS